MMLSNTSALKVNQKLAQLDVALKSNLITDKTVERLFSESDDINSRASCITKKDYFFGETKFGKTALHFAFDKPSVSTFECLLRLGADFLVTDENNSTIVHLAVKESRKYFIDIILSLQIKYGNVTNFCNNDGISHFHAACMTNNVQAVEFFLNSGASINHTVNEDSSDFAGFSPLHFASTYCSYEVAKMLLEHGANLYIKDEKGMTSLHMVLESSFKAIEEEEKNFYYHSSTRSSLVWDNMKKLFLVHMTKSNTTIIDESGLSNFHVACAIQNFSVAKQFLKNFTNIDHPVSIESKLWPGYTALHFAFYFNLDVVKLLVKNGADLRVKNLNNITPLDLILKRYKEEDICAILSINKIWKNIVFSDKKTKLLDVVAAMKDYSHFSKFLRRFSKKVDISIPINSPLWPGYTLLHLVVLFYKSEYFSYRDPVNKTIQMIKELLEKKNDLMYVQDIHGRTPIHTCFRLLKSSKLLDTLLELYEKLDNPHDIIDKDNLSLLHIACARDNESLVEKLLRSSNNANLVYKGESIADVIVSAWTPLHVAVAKKSINVIIPLLEHGSDIYATDANGQTPIHLAYIYEVKKVGRILLSTEDLKDAVVNSTGLSHLHVACFCNNVDAVKELLDIGVDVNTVYESSPLQVAVASNCSFDIVDLLIKKGANAFIKNHFSLPLIYDGFDYPYILKINHEYFVAILRQDENLYEQVKQETGLTKLHFACIMNNIKYIKLLLGTGAKINERMKLNSPIWPGYTPLHILIRQHSDDKNIRNAIQLMLSKGADVTLPNAEQETPLHLAYQLYLYKVWYMYGKRSKKLLVLLDILLNAQTDFSINPISLDGITHFHVACHTGNTFVVEKYLEQDINELNHPISFFFHHDSKIPQAGFTPLHLAVICKENYVDTATQLEIVDMLLKHGADVNAQDSGGNTPLHIANDFAVIERIIKAGADKNMINALGQTPLERLLSRSVKSTENIRNWLKNGFYYNAYNIDTEVGCIADSMGSYGIPINEMPVFMYTVAINFPLAIQTDDMGRTVIHNIVSSKDHSDIKDHQFTALIMQLSRAGFDVNSQDNLGRTALHVAVHFRNITGISGLLMAGADVNMKDVVGRVPIEYSFGHCCGKLWMNKCEHSKMIKIIAVHIKKLQLCDIDVCELNQIQLQRAIEIFKSIEVEEQFFNELDELENVKIDGYSISLRNLLSETDIVADYTTMPQMKRDAIDKFFRSNEVRNFHEKFGELAGLVRLQYRKAVMRCQLVEDAKDSLALIAGFPWPDICFHIIIKSLTNTDLKNLIISTTL